MKWVVANIRRRRQTHIVKVSQMFISQTESAALDSTLQLRRNKSRRDERKAKSVQKYVVQI